MIKKIFIAINVALIWGMAIAWFFSPSKAGVTCSVTYNLMNGTTADASQVMQNYNDILACLANNTAASGTNADITALAALATPLTAAQGGTTTYIGGTSTGTNTIVVTATPAGFSLSLGKRVVFVAGGSNGVGPTTLNVSGTGAIALDRASPYGLTPLVGGEIVTGMVVEATYDGAQWQMTSAPAIGHVTGEVFDMAGNGCPAGSLEATGGGFSTGNYPLLNGVIAGTWGGAGVLPDLYGRATYERDLTGARITLAAGNFTGSTVGAVGGVQNRTIVEGYMPIYNLYYTDTGHTHGAGSGFSNYITDGANNASVYTAGSSGRESTTTGTTVITSLTISSRSTMSPTQSTFPVLSNAAIVFKCVKG